MGIQGEYLLKQIFESVWSDYYCADDNTIMVHISRLREKLEDSPKNPVYIKRSGAWV